MVAGMVVGSAIPPVVLLAIHHGVDGATDQSDGAENNSTDRLNFHGAVGMGRRGSGHGCTIRTHEYVI